MTRVRVAVGSALLMVGLHAGPAAAEEPQRVADASEAASAAPVEATEIETETTEPTPPQAVGTASPAATAEAATTQLSWKDGKTSFETENVRIQLSNRVQLRFTRDSLGDASGGFFELRRAKTKLTGWLYAKQFQYGLQLNWADNLNPLEDAFLNYDFADGRAAVTLGQFKAPFGRQELTSSGSQQFVDRSLVSKAFARGRDIGLQLHGRLGGGLVEWRAGIFNGNGRTRARNTDDHYQVDARLQLAPNGDPKYSEADHESRDRPLYAVAVGFQRRDLALATALQTTWAVDGVFKYRGLSLFAEAFFASEDPLTADATAQRPGGFHAQIGQLLARRRLELALRYGRLDPDRDAADDQKTEVGAALSYYFRKHGLKAQADVRRLEGSEGAGFTQVRFQTQFVF